MTTSGPRKDHRLVVALASLSVALLALTLFLASRLAGGGAQISTADALRDPEVRREVMAQLLAENEELQMFDSHPDPEVSRVLLPSGERAGSKSNAMGMRERDFAIEKPPDLVRVAILGDSFVFGLGIADGERIGAVLEHHLNERARAPHPRFECLSLGVNSWNIRAECSFLRRQIDRLRPDLIVQITVSNDLDDVTSVRGFGAESTFPSRHRERADSLVLDRHAQLFLGFNTRNFLGRGEDWESRTRFADALDAIQQLRAAAERLPSAPRHLLLVHWGPLAPIFHRELGSKLAPDSILYLPVELATDKHLWLTAVDPHWNAEGNARVAEFLYGVVRARGLLPGVELAEWPEAEERARDWTERGLAFARDKLERVRELVHDTVSVVDTAEISLEEARQVQGGLDREGLVSPYATLVLQRPDAARELHVTGRALPDAALAGARTRIFLEELEVGVFELRPDAALELRLPLPPALDGRAFLNLRFESSDYVYRGDDQRHCVSFRLERAALE